jgi:hypothetical protein
MVAGLALALACAPTVAMAQDGGVTGSVELTTDQRRRGLSWSEGKAALDATMAVPVGQSFRLEGRAATTRGSARHGGADVALDGSAQLEQRLGGWTVTAGATGHVFVGNGGSGLGYVEVGAGAGYLIGPAQLDLAVDYAPDQRAIGGDNFYLSARTSVGIPTTPWTLRAHVGRSSGSVDDPFRAARLRPGGRYVDWGLGVERVQGPLAIGVRYAGNDIAEDRIIASPFADRRNSGDRVTAHVALVF